MATKWQTSGQATYPLVVKWSAESLARQISNPQELCWLWAGCIYSRGKFSSSVGNTAGTRTLVLHLYLAQIVYTYELPEGNRKPIHMQLGLYILSMCMNLWLYERPYPVTEVFDDPKCSRPSYSISFTIKVLYNLFTGFQPAINTNDLPIKAGVSLHQEDYCYLRGGSFDTMFI